MKPRFITFEGGEGAGKSTQVALLKSFLQDQGIEVLTTREPGGSLGAEEIRGLLLQGEADRWDGLSELFLHCAARRDHLVKTIWPALAQNKWVICDRFFDSTIAYQGWGHGLDLQTIDQAITLCLGDFKPDLTLILDLDVTQGLKRARERELERGLGQDRYERLGLPFHDNIRQGFLNQAERHPERCRVINAHQTKERVHAQVIELVEALLS